jgi:NADH-quinone oxidoreductase subunit M
MGYVVLGLGVWSATAPDYVGDYWKMGMNGAMFQMIAHGISSAGMFFLVGVLYDRVHHRDLNRFGGLFAKMPVYSGISIVIFFAALGLPGLCGFIGEIFVTLSVWNYSKALAIIAASVVILTAGYILWVVQRVYLGPEYKGPHAEALTRITGRELAIAAPLVALAILLGVYPQALFAPLTPSVNETVDQMIAWQKRAASATYSPADTVAHRAPAHVSPMRAEPPRVNDVNKRRVILRGGHTAQQGRRPKNPPGVQEILQSPTKAALRCPLPQMTGMRQSVHVILRRP